MPAERSVFILEDEPLIAALIEEVIKELGCNVIGPALRWDETSELLAHHDPDFAILDIKIEGESSYPIAGDLKRRGVPFLFTTGYDAGEIDTTFGCPVITKPFDPSYLQGVSAGLLRLPMPENNPVQES